MRKKDLSKIAQQPHNGNKNSQDPQKHLQNSHELPPTGLRFPCYILSRDKIKYVRGDGKMEDPHKCLLCEIVKKTSEIPSWEIYRDQRTLVMLNAYPYTTGHLMIVPLEHFEHYEHLPRDLLIHLNLMIQQCILLLQKTYSPYGFNIGLNQGKWGGASILHLHVHIVPRYGAELNFMEVIGGTRIVIEPLEATLKTLKAHVELLHLNQTSLP
ncbi:MAG: HIT family protein [Candidatus Heimdallarchaeota archaeon]